MFYILTDLYRQCFTHSVHSETFKQSSKTEIRCKFSEKSHKEHTFGYHLEEPQERHVFWLICQSRKKLKLEIEIQCAERTSVTIHIEYNQPIQESI